MLSKLSGNRDNEIWLLTQKVLWHGRCEAMWGRLTTRLSREEESSLNVSGWIRETGERMCKYERDVNVPLKNEFWGEEQTGASAIFSKYNIKTYKQNNLFKSFLSFSSENIRCLISAHSFQTAETVKSNENALLKMHHMANYQIKNVLHLFHV